MLQWAAMASRRRLGQILLEAGLVNQDVLEAGLERGRRERERLGEALIALRAIGREDLLKALATQAGLPFLGREEIPSALPVIKTLSAKYLRQYVACPP